MKIPKAKLFSPADLANLRLGFYTQAPTVAALLATSVEDVDGPDVNRQWLAESTVQLIEALIAEISEVTI